MTITNSAAEPGVVVAPVAVGAPVDVESQQPKTGASGTSSTKASTATAVSMGSGVSAKPPLRVSGKATASMWCGIVGIIIFGIVLGPIAIILGVSAKNDIAANPDELEGESQAKAGIICGCVALLLWLIVIVIAISG